MGCGATGRHSRGRRPGCCSCCRPGPRCQGRAQGRGGPQAAAAHGDARERTVSGAGGKGRLCASPSVCMQRRWAGMGHAIRAACCGAPLKAGQVPTAVAVRPCIPHGARGRPALPARRAGAAGRGAGCARLGVGPPVARSPPNRALARLPVHLAAAGIAPCLPAEHLAAAAPRRLPTAAARLPPSAAALRARWEAADAETLEAAIRRYKDALSAVLQELEALGAGQWQLDATRRPRPLLAAPTAECIKQSN